MHPQLAKTYGPKFNRFPCYCQPKLNGVRALYQNGVWQSRGQHGQDGKIWAPDVLAHLTKQLALLQDGLGPSIVLDGELYVHGWKLQRINGAVATNRTYPRDDTHEVQFHIFDAVTDFSMPFSRRWMDLYNLLQQVDLSHVRAVPTALCGSRSDVDLHFHHYTSLGYEGIMLRPDGPYVPGRHLSSRTGTETEKRSDFLWKHKAWQDAEFMCIGFTQGQGKASIGIGALVFRLPHPTIPCQVFPKPEPKTFEVGTGFDDAERVEFMKNPPIGKLCKVRYLELTADGKPFNPSFLAVMP